MKELARILIYVPKIFNCLSKYCCQYTSQLLRKNVKYSCDQATFRMAHSKKLPYSGGSRSYPSIFS